MNGSTLPQNAMQHDDSRVVNFWHINQNIYFYRVCCEVFQELQQAMQNFCSNISDYTHGLANLAIKLQKGSPLHA